MFKSATSKVDCQPYFPLDGTRAPRFFVECTACLARSEYRCFDFIQMLRMARQEGWKIGFRNRTYVFECLGCSAMARYRLDAAIREALLNEPEE